MVIPLVQAVFKQAERLRGDDKKKRTSSARLHAAFYHQPTWIGRIEKRHRETGQSDQSNFINRLRDIYDHGSEAMKRAGRHQDMFESCSPEAVALLDTIKFNKSQISATKFFTRFPTGLSAITGLAAIGKTEFVIIVVQSFPEPAYLRWQIRQNSKISPNSVSLTNQIFVCFPNNAATDFLAIRIRSRALNNLVIKNAVIIRMHTR